MIQQLMVFLCEQVFVRGNHPMCIGFGLTKAIPCLDDKR